MKNEPMEVERAKALAVFTYQMSAMIDVGFCLGMIVETLSDAAPPPYDEFCRPISARWKQKENECLALSTIMEERPELFPDFYIKTIRCGEIGGVWHHIGELAELLGDTLRIWSARGRPLEWIKLLLSPAAQQVQEWSQLDDGQRKLVLYLFCKSFGMMLSAGVPLARAGETAACFLPAKQRESFRADMAEYTVRREEQISSWLANTPYADAFLVRMVYDGETCGTLDSVMEKAALVYQRQLEIESA